MSIDWKNSAELNKCTINELKAYFIEFPKSHKKVVAICNKCGKIRNLSKSQYHDLCFKCANIGRKDSDETKLKKSVSATGRKKSEEHKRKIGLGNKGLKRTEAANQKNREYHLGRKQSKKTIEKRRNANTGLKRSKKSLQRMSAAQQGIPYDEWEAFACEKKYCPKFDKACRESCRAKYNYECFVCGLPQSKNKTKTGKVRKLSVHHVDMDKAQGCESNWKLVPLCMHHHATAHNDELVARLGYLIKEKIK